jgi:hypothetical protein
LFLIVYLADPRHWVTQPLPGILGVIRPFRGYLRYARLKLYGRQRGRSNSIHGTA